MASVQSVDTSAEVDNAPDPRRWWALGIIAIAQLMVVLDASIVNIALPSAQADLGISDANRQWVVTAYTLAFGGLLLLGGRIADYTGRKRIFLIGLIGFALASALGGAATNDVMLFGARALQGVFAALLAPAALSLLQVGFTDAKERARAFGVYGAISGGGAAIGLILGGVLTEYVSWRWCLFVNVPIAILAAVAAVGVVRESKAHGDTRYDIPGAVLVSGGLAALVYGFTQAAEATDGWTDTSTITWLVAAAVLLIGFVVWETRTHHPLLPLRVVLDRNRGAAYLSSLLIGAGLFAMFLFLAYYFQQNLGYSAVKSGFAFLPFSAGIIVSATVASSLMPKVNPRILLVVGGVLATAGLALLTRIELDSSWLTLILPAEVLISLGMGLFFVVSASLALTKVEEHDAGVASAMLNTSQQIGGALGTALLNTLFASAVTNWMVDNAAGGNPAEAAIHGYHVAFWVGSAFIATATVAVLLMVNARSKDLSAGDMVHVG
ncbi:MFS transporter [Kineosporia succinea]|uniref:EmrB/QacA subfamily drug resistance transporter n=1 Tax=Kineosporia succinea TaxID=84632 RepID=A0ABT9NYK0_9ACTN|nr:MFS transporter [Kineosporia succinea]MDP9825518.1 EmrB/QacA subfamily drug resistance transporter [Kineosporia succinea]